MAGLTFIGSSRPVFDGGAKTLTFAYPAAALKGDLLVALVAYGTAVVPPAGWTALGTLGSGGVLLDVAARLVDDAEPSSYAWTTAAEEVQGQLLALRGGRPEVALEASADGAFAATLAPAAPASSSLQAINLAICAWSAGAAANLTPPAAYTSIDAYSSAVIAARSLLVAYAITKTIGAVAPGAAASDVAVTGRAFTLICRDRMPIQPDDLYDPIPGNVGLIGQDLRPGREV